MQIDWQNKGAATTKIDDELIKELLFYEGSLTRYLKSRCKGQLTVQIQSESWELPFEDERIALDLKTNEKTFVRLSNLQSENNKIVNARTVIPEQTYNFIKVKLEALGERPLGELLFSESSNYRADMKYAKVPVEYEWYVQSNFKHNETHWGRQSVFIVSDMPLLITEIFLPTIHECVI